MSRWPKVPGGGVKGKNSPIYWVRRATQDARYRAKTAAAAERVDERFTRITDATKSFCAAGGSMTADEKKVVKLQSLIEAYEAQKGLINADIDNAGQAELNKLATAAKRLIIFLADLKQLHAYSHGAKIFDISDQQFDFS